LPKLFKVESPVEAQLITPLQEILTILKTTQKKIDILSQDVYSYRLYFYEIQYKKEKDSVKNI